ncbi:hypothetical protein FHS76_002006 [Ochrobactrum daejeonense]|uniref:Uncharacterized protein n=1 Tax=Brucella daejeonensis TaxID=659015 RepID=A0A7W9AX40_9HYPH|nr:hypothetical protein [Brucella daejeonensis]MBB5702131.1 hypothetical protein [Brucella daejeonensis]
MNIMDMRIKPKGKRKAKKLPNPGADGTKIFNVAVRLSPIRSENRSVRALPGTFEWRYARAKGNVKDVKALFYHAGSQYAQVWEKAGIANMGSPNLEALSGGARPGLTDGRCKAIEELRRALKYLGTGSTLRLIAYCADGKTTKEIAKRFGSTEREMGHVLHNDLRELARFYKLLAPCGQHIVSGS